MKSKEEILNNYKICTSQCESCNGCTYFSDGLCLDNGDYMERDIIAYLESNTEYKDGMNKSWEIIKTACNMNYDDFFECFGYDGIDEIIKNYTANEVAQKIKDWENKKFHVGDIVYTGTIANKDICGVVINIYNSWLEVLTDNRTVEQCLKKDATKNGKHLDIDSLFNQIEKMSV